MRVLKFHIVDNNEELKNKKNLSNTKYGSENVQLYANHKYSGNEQMPIGGVSAKSSFSTKNFTPHMLASSTQCQKDFAYKTCHEALEQPERNTGFCEKMAAERFQKTSKPHFFARTHSSPDLSDSSVEIFSGGQRNRKPEGGSQFTYERLAPHGCGRNLNAEVPVDYAAVTLEEASSIRHSLSERDLCAVVADSNGVLHGYQSVSRFPSLGKKFGTAYLIITVSTNGFNNVQIILIKAPRRYLGVPSA